MKGVPLRLEIGPRDIEAGQCVLVRRDNREKTIVKLDELETKIPSCSRLYMTVCMSVLSRTVRTALSLPPPLRR